MFTKNAFLLGISLGIMAAPAMADPVIYDGGGPNGVTGYYADTTYIYTADAVPFTLTGDAAITDAHWWGSCDGSTCASTDFLLSFYQDNGSGSPGALIGSSFSVGNAGETATGGLIASTYTEYRYSAAFSAVNLLAGVNYWLGISRDGKTDTGIWFMETTSTGGHAQYLTGTGWTSQSDKLAFNLTGRGAGTVPEPAALALMGLGLAGLGMGKRRRIA